MDGALQIYKRLCYGRGTARDHATRLSVEILQLQNIPFEDYSPGLSCNIICVILCLAVFTQYRSVTDTQTHRETDGRTDTR